MAIIKCKMCGGDLEVNESMTIGTCKYCGSTMTLPKQTDDLKANLFNRANYYRRNNEYDKAAEVYESILNQDATEAEAYWGLILCKYGIDYVEDPDTHKLVPTCHRTQYGSIFTDSDYIAAIENADYSAKSVYEQEAKKIEGIQKQILEISSKEEPFDVFICYKETNEAGTRTQDSVLAQDIYYQLRKEGYKVFFSRITLEKKLGSAYEPYIFAALNSAKVMVVIATKPEFVNAVWVKNEWNRYLALIKNGENKTLIPAYKDMNPYELPEEFSYLQALDMAKLGFMQDLLHGIRKLINASSDTHIQSESAQSDYYSPTEEPLLDRAFLCLEDGDFEKADGLLEQVLNLNPRNAKAYVGKLMVQFRKREEKGLGELSEDFSNNNDYKKAIRFSDDQHKKELEPYLQAVLQRIEDARKEELYQKALSEMRNSSTEAMYLRTAGLFKEIPDYKDAATLIEKCEGFADQLKQEKLARQERENEQNYIKALELKNQSTTDLEFKEAVNRFWSIKDYKDSEELAYKCALLAKEYLYQKALEMKSGAITKDDYTRAEKLFKHISGYKDSDVLAEDCKQSASDIFKLENEKKRRKKRLITITIGIFGSIIALVSIYYIFVIPSIEKREKRNLYNQAVELNQEKKYQEAAEIFVELGNYKDSASQARESLYQHALNQYQEKNYYDAIEIFLQLGDYKDSEYQAFQSLYQRFEDLFSSSERWKSITKLLENSNHLDLNNPAVTYPIYSHGLISAGSAHIVGLVSNDKVVAIGLNPYGQLDIENWENIIAVDTGVFQTVGLKRDGSVVSVGLNLDSQNNMGHWSNIFAVAAGEGHIVGLKLDGTVVAVGNNTYGQININSWDNIIAVAAGYKHTIGLKEDGTVVGAGLNHFNQLDLNSWDEIISLDTGKSHTVGLKSDGTVVAVGNNSSGQLDVGNWDGIIAVAAGGIHTVGLKPDGTVVAVGNNSSGQLNVDNWQNIIAISAGDSVTVGLRADGSFVAVGDNFESKLELANWNLFN